MAYATVRDCVERRGEEDLRPLADDPHAETLAWDELEAALEDASDEIDAYIGARHELPLDPVPRVLQRLCVELGIYRRADSADRGTEEMRRRYEDGIRLLKDIQSGRASLGPADPDPPARSDMPAVSIEAEPRSMTREDLGRIL